MWTEPTLSFVRKLKQFHHTSNISCVSLFKIIVCVFCHSLALYGLRNPQPVGKLKLPDWLGQFCPTQLGGLNFPIGWESFFVPPSQEV